MDDQSPSPSFFEFPTPSAPPSPAASTKSTFFNRSRSNSLHSSSTTSRRGSEAPLPPLPPLPRNPPSSTSSFSSSSFRLATAEDNADYPPIKSVTVPHHGKVGGRWVFACRVVPACQRLSVSKDSSSMVRTGSLGPMELAGVGEEGAREPHTVWRTWSEFVEFSTALSLAFPVIAPTSFNSSNPSDNSLPNSFYRQTPRLSKKITIFVTRNVLAQRQDDLDMFSRRLFEMPDIVRKSSLVRDFFRLRETDMLNSPMSPSASSSDASSPPSPEDEPESFAQFLSEITSPDATIRAISSKSKGPKRPALGLKRSTPDLRKLMMHETDPLPFDVPFELRPGSNKSMNRPLIPTRFTSPAEDIAARSSKYSISASSTCSSTTVTPASLSSASTVASSVMSSRLPSPLALDQPLLHPVNFNDQADFSPLSSPVSSSTSGLKRPKQFLRHFYSLQDLRRQHNDVPSSPIPFPSSSDMYRAQTQPLPRSAASYPPVPPTRMARTSSTGSSSAPHLHRQRSGSKSSTSSSFDDGQLPTSPNPHTMSFRHNQSGRLDRVPEVFASGRRPSLPRNSSAATKASCGHSPSPSTSSVNSSRSSAARSSFDMGRSTSSPNYGGYRSRRSSTDYSDVSFAPATPPTPLHLDSDFGSGKYFVNESGALSQNNTVPPPPFFPVPGCMAATPMQQAYSYDGMPHSPRFSHGRRSSGDSRSRAASSASGRPPLDTILGSPLASSRSSSSSAPHSPRPQDRPTVTLKILYPDSNLVLRVPRNISLAHLRAQIDLKLAISAGVKLEQWAMSYTTQGRISGDAVGHSEIILSEEDFRLAIERTAHLAKVALRIVH